MATSVRRLAACAVVVATALRPRPSSAQEARYAERESMTFLTVTGLSIFGSVYVASIPATAAIATSEGSKFSGSHAEIMAIPFAGPWMEAAGVVERQSSKGLPGFIAVGLLQVVGATLAVVGVVGRERRVPASRLAFAAVPSARGLSLGLSGPL